MPTPADALALITHATEEVLTRELLADYLARGIPLRHYIGLEISGQIHLGTGLMCMGKVADLQRAGVATSVFLADWHSWINDKLGGDRKVIAEVAVGYFKLGLEASLRCCGGDPAQVKWVLGSELYEGNTAYWETVVDVSKNTPLNRVKRSITILGRGEGDGVDFAKMLYPVMQVADIFAQGITLAHAGMDQRKAHVIAIDVAPSLVLHPLRGPAGENLKPVAIHHPLILGLGKPPKRNEGEDVPAWLARVKPELKMSKSKPDNAVFVHDEPDEIVRKLNKAYCLEGDTTFNPVLDWAEKVLFSRAGFALEIARKPEHGGNVRYASYAELEAAFTAKALHPGDLKRAVAEALIAILEPARAAFAENPGRALLARMRDLGVTR